MNAAIWRNLTVSRSLSARSRWKPQCSERSPPSAWPSFSGVWCPDEFGQIVVEVPGRQWMCQSISLSGSMTHPGSEGGTLNPAQPTAARTLMPPGAVPTVTPIVSFLTVGPASCTQPLGPAGSGPVRVWQRLSIV